MVSKGAPSVPVWDTEPVAAAQATDEAVSLIRLPIIMNDAPVHPVAARAVMNACIVAEMVIRLVCTVMEKVKWIVRIALTDSPWFALQCYNITNPLQEVIPFPFGEG